MNNLLNFALFQGLWFACILGAAEGKVWPGLLVLGIFCLWQLRPDIRAHGDFRLMLLCAVIGLVLDTLWVQLGLIQYQAAMPFDTVAPVWIVALWIGMALILNHSCNWLKSKLWLAAILGGIGSPLSYLAGSRLGAAEVAPGIQAYILFGLSWAILMPVLVYLAIRWADDYQPLTTKSTL